MYKPKKSRLTITEMLTITVIVLVVAIPVSIPILKVVGLNIPYSDGERTGVVYKISEKGALWKTNEGELSLQMTARNAENQLVNEKFLFSVTDTAVVKQLEEAARSGDIVTLRYKQYLMRGYKYGDTSYDIVQVIPRDPED